MSKHELNAPNKLVTSLVFQKNTGKYCDIQLKFGYVELRAHACVVGSFSALVDELVSTGEVMTSMWSEIPTVTVPLDSDKFSCQPCASKVIEFMYLGKIQIDDLHLDHIRVLSCGLRISELQKICDSHFKKFASESDQVPFQSKYNFKQDLLKNTAKPEGKTECLPSRDTSAATTQQENVTIQPETRKEELPVSRRELFAGDDTLEDKEWAGVTCPVCHVTFMSVVKFQQHSSSHLGKIYTTCFVCSYASLRVSDLIKHLHEKNHGEKVCSLCLFEASSNESLKEHLQQHDHSQPFFCLTCSTRFQTRTALNSHIVKHSSETPHRCNECGRGFKWKHGLQSHMVIHTSIKKLLCDQCGFSTAHLKSFTDHKSVHSGETFKCPIADCKFKSVRKESVKQHLSTHSKEKPYQCEICGQAFSQAKNLRRHAAIHDPCIDPEQCPLCPFQTTRSDKFRDHFRRFHKNGDKGKTAVNLTEKAHLKDKEKKKSGSTRKSKKHDAVDEALTSAKNLMGPDSESGNLSSPSVNIAQSNNSLSEFQPSCPTSESVVNLVSASNYPFIDLSSTNVNVTILTEENNCSNGSPSQVSRAHDGSASEFLLSMHQPQRTLLSVEEPDSDLRQRTPNKQKETLSVNNKLLIYCDSGSQVVPYTLYLCEGTLLASSGNLPCNISEATSLNDSANSATTSAIRPDIAVCTNDMGENGMLSLTCHENLNFIENSELESNGFYPIEGATKIIALNNISEQHVDFCNDSLES